MTNNFSLAFGVMINAALQNLNTIAENQAQDTTRATRTSAIREIDNRLSRMSTIALNRRFFRTFGVHGCFNVFNSSYDERRDMINELINYEMRDFAPAQTISAIVELQSFMNVLGIAPRQTGRFSEDQVREIRITYLMGGTSYRRMGATYGVSGDMIRSIVIGESYATICTELIMA